MSCTAGATDQTFRPEGILRSKELQVGALSSRFAKPIDAEGVTANSPGQRPG